MDYAHACVEVFYIRFAEKIGASKIALGHHQDDIVETFFLNMFFNAQLKAMPPKLLSDNKKHVVIRPLALSKERTLRLMQQ